MKRSSFVAAILLVALVLALILLAPSPTDEVVQDRLKGDDARMILAGAIGAFLMFLLGFGIRDAVGRRTSRTGRGAPAKPGDP